MQDERIEQELEQAARRYATSQGAKEIEVLSIMDMSAPDAIGPHWGLAIRACWPSSGFQPRLRAFVVVRHEARYWFLGLSDMWLHLIAEEAYRLMEQQPAGESASHAR